ncbi:MAG TPA: urease subunit alpha [Actinomycetota bacterium]|nr:urease subunit alpha [Actinomycetota bacterium]
MPSSISREEHALRHGPTTGDRVRLGDTDLWVRIEDDLTEPADQALWGYAKTLRSRMTQQDGATSASELDAVIGSAIVVDPLLGIVKADLGVKDGRIAGIGRAGNPDITDGVDLTVGPGTWPIPCHGLIATPGGIDSHVHLLSPRLVPVALSAGVTTLITAGFEEPAWRMHRTLEAFEFLPVNVGLQASARADRRAPLDRSIEAGSVGLKIHEDWGAYPEIVDATLAAAEAHDVAVCLHTDGLNESTELEGTIDAIGGRTIHAYHVEGAGGGHVPDVLGLVRVPNVLCSSTTPGLPWGRAADLEHTDMILIVHEGNPSLADDVAAAKERIRATTMAAEGPLHELGAISIVNSDSQGMGRIGETIRRTWQLAHAMKAWRATGAGGGWPEAPHARRLRPRPTESAVDDGIGRDDNERVLAYLAKYTAEPAIVHGIVGEVGSLSPGRLADIVLWEPAMFGVRPSMVIKGGVVAWSAMGEGNASVHGAEPTRYGPDWGGTGEAAARLSTTFVARAAVDAGVAATLGTRRRIVAVGGTRGLTRGDLVANTAVPEVVVSPDDGQVTLGARVLSCEPVDEVPLSRPYLLA